MKFLEADLAGAAGVQGLMTLRRDGHSAGPGFAETGGGAGFNVGSATGDDAQAVMRNRQCLHDHVGAPLVWVRQVHGTRVLTVVRTIERAGADTLSVNDAGPLDGPQADALVTDEAGIGLVIQTADCLPVLLAAVDGRVIGAAHAGWRGLAAGVLENTLAAMRARQRAPATIVAWLGVGIGAASFEVGPEVRAAFLADDPDAGVCFSASPRRPGHWYADLAGLARRRLSRAGVAQVRGAPDCTVANERDFYSYRRDRRCGRMATVIWRD
ncbi:MAG: peptidoglycan editing factor PgeF [Burkholderiaceae bacterium]